MLRTRKWVKLDPRADGRPWLPKRVRKDQVFGNNRQDGNGTQVNIIEGMFVMGHLNNDLRADFVEALEEISTLMSIAYDQLGPLPEDHALAQAGLENGGEIVLDYVDHNEAGVAFEHLLYMINEPPLVVSEKCIKILARIAKSLKLPFTR